MKLSWLVDRMLKRPSPPFDERSIKAAQLDEMTEELRSVTSHVDQLVPSPEPLRGRLERRVASYGRIRIR